MPGQKKTCPGSKKNAPRSKNIQPNVSAYNNGVPPPPYGGKVHEAGARVQKTETELRNNEFGSRKKVPGSSTNTCRSKENISTGSRKHTGKPPTFFVTLGPKRIPVRSKKHVQVQKKGAQVQKACIQWKMLWGSARSETNASKKKLGHLPCTVHSPMFECVSRSFTILHYFLLWLWHSQMMSNVQSTLHCGTGWGLHVPHPS